MAEHDKPLKAAIEAVGGERALAKLVGISHPALSRWKRIPPARVLQVEAITKIRREILRPDLYPRENP